MDATVFFAGGYEPVFELILDGLDVVDGLANAAMVNRRLNGLVAAYVGKRPRVRREVRARKRIFNLVRMAGREKQPIAGSGKEDWL